MAISGFQSFRITVEIPLLLLTYSIMVQKALYTNLSIYRTCYTILDYPKENCSQLGNEDNNMTELLEPKVQPTVNHINMVQSTIQSTIPLFICIYVGLWSDRFGRKPFLIASLTGALVSAAANVLIVYFEDLTTWWFIASMMPYVLTGETGAFMLLVTTYIADITTSEQRALRLALFEVIFGLSSVFGNFSASYLFYATNYATVYLITMSLLGFSLLYTIFVLPESLKGNKEVQNSKEKIKLTNVKDLVKNIFKKRPNNGRIHLLSILGIILLQNFTIGEMTVLTLFLRAKFYWTLSKITLVNSIASILNIIGTVFSTVVLHKLLKIEEFPLVLLASISHIISNILRANATNDIYLYISYCAFAFRGMGGIMLRTVTSFIISSQEMGKVFAVISILTSLDELTANIIYPMVYNATLHTNSGIFNYMSLGMMAVGSILIIYMMNVNYAHYEPPTKEEDLDAKKNMALNNMDIFTPTQRMSLEIGTRTFSLRSITNTPIP
ncbi:proton-coupled folate transporter-like [Diorhabda carinulata]|uniref:proton-coupled folate transporter-like n=1 Tax=Diorhabda carinulata TaxID=1163345 RepID=UPI0025A0BD78|nr:proton-coupled folate transporter-like [Diorhabda carinulata]